jgi:DNA modification methylase
MVIDPDLLDKLPPDLRIEIEERITTEPLKQSELADMQTRFLGALKKRTRRGTRTDLRLVGSTCTHEDVHVVKPTRRENCTEKVAKLFGESEATVRKRLEVFEAADVDRSTRDELLAKMDKDGSPHWAHQRLMAAKAAKADHSDQVPIVKAKPVVQPGECWLLGRHRLVCGDAMNMADVERLRAGRDIDLVVTSPPFNQGIEKFTAHKKYMGYARSWQKKVASLAYKDSMPEADYQEWQRRFLESLYGLVRDGGTVCYHHKNRYREKEMISPLEWILLSPFKRREEIIWRRPGLIAQNARMFIPSDERIYWLYKGDDFTFNDTPEIRQWSSVWDIKLETNKHHPVAFPTELPRRCIEACSRPSDTVYDPYVGSGTTIIAAEMMGRDCLAMEIEPRFCGVAIEKWQRLTKKEAVLEGTGETYTQRKRELEGNRATNQIGESRETGDHAE